MGAFKTAILEVLWFDYEALHSYRAANLSKASSRAY
ncbi:hypothetical protein Spica_0805 [Gracilinema caldarium DSM 7334]|uniref:Uncharacterized protein n=1 Tax=Gracilinema caldarium (strain ATCC 51460 / DSM 7334 / H1) TaxID=744872 RepID=F8F095_GRAC1|nr:hypothetical protein Spica_0805 [Gracilinema caldarium DSM 7334]